MRPYRGKTKDGKEVHGCYVEIDGEHFIVIPEACYQYTEDGYLISGMVEVIPETVGQSTGLHWKNDILESQDGLRRYIVTYNDKECKWYLKGIGKAWAENDPVWSEYNHIGNVHDNPELEIE